MSHQLAIMTEGLTKRYGKSRGCEGVSLAVPAGQIFGFLGPNGAGKSTVVKVLAGLHAPTSGSASIFGHAAGSPAAGRLLGFVPELFGVPVWATAHEMLCFYAQVSEIPAREIASRVDESLQRVGLPAGVGKQKTGAFSKGMRQRLCIAAAMLHRPRLLLLDEPTSALDPVGRREIRDLMLSLRKEGTTILLNSHILSDVEMVADRVAIIVAGRIIMAGPPSELVVGSLSVRLHADPVSPELERSLARLGRLEQQGAGRLFLHLNRHEDLGQVAQAVVASGAQLLELTPQRRSLEELFMTAVDEKGAAASA